MPGFQELVAEEVEDDFHAFRGKLAASLSAVATAHRRGFDGTLNGCMIALSGIVAAFEQELARFAPNTAGNSISIQ